MTTLPTGGRAPDRSPSGPPGRTALVTGANKGIGLETARRLGALGYRVWLGARDAARGEAAAAGLRAAGHDVRALSLDITDDASVAAAAARLAAEAAALDALVSNAGIVLAPDAPPSALPLDAMRATYEVNVFGGVRVIQAFLPLLRAAPAARIVTLSSGLGSLTDAADPRGPFYEVNLLGYNSSKSALNMVTLAFAKELRDTAIKVNAADPGFTATDLNGFRGARTVGQAADIVVRLATLGPDGPTGGFFNDDGPLPW